METTIKEILDIGRRDEDEWISVFSEMLENYVTDQSLKRELSNDSFRNILRDVGAKIQQSLPKFVPLEYSYLNKKLITQIPPITNHFTLKKRFLKNSLNLANQNL